VYSYVLRPARQESNADGYSMPAMFNGPIVLAAGQSNIVIEIAGGVLAGTVKGADGKPKAEAMVVLSSAAHRTELSQRMLARYGRTDGAGRFRVEGVQAGAYEVAVQHAEGLSPKRTISVGASNWVDLVLSPGVAVKGTVLDASGRGARGAAVMAMDAGSDEHGGMGTVDEDGAFAIEPPLPAGEYRFFVLQTGCAVEALQLKLAGATNIAFRLAPGGDASVTVRAGGKPAEGKVVQVKAADGREVLRVRNALYANMGPWGRCAVAPTDAEGRTTVQGLKPGRYTVAIEGSRSTAKVEIKPLETAEVTLDL
jgi:protocatechuate 3,4-dioxygenase beta subunit